MIIENKMCSWKDDAVKTGFGRTFKLGSGK